VANKIEKEILKKGRKIKYAQIAQKWKTGTQTG
jgi:hypothetical protein